MAQFEQVGKAFVEHYYTTMETGRNGLSNLYNEDSLMTFEGMKCCGNQAIMQKIMSLSFKVIQHSISTVDFQPVENFGVLVNVMGQLKTDEDPPHSFSQSFIIRQMGEAFYIANEIFRMVLHNQAS